MSEKKPNNRKTFNEIKRISDHLITNISKNHELSLSENTIDILLRFDKALKSILETLLFIEKNEESHYSFCILYRSVIEMFFKGIFIVDQGQKGADDMAKEFTKTGLLETKCYFDLFKEYLTDDARIETEDLFAGMLINSDKEILNSFKFKNVLNSIKAEEFDSKFKDKFLEDYFVLCSYVHGGFFALESFYVSDYTKPSNKNILNFTLYIFLFNRMNIFIVYTNKLDLTKPYQPILENLMEIQTNFVESM